MVVALPDVIGALLAHTLADPDVSAFVSNRISGRARVGADDPARWTMPTKAIVFQEAGGPGGADFELVQLQTARVDALCYGENALEAKRVLRLLHAFLCPAPGSGSDTWVAAATRVFGVRQASGFINAVEPVTGWARAQCSYFVTYGERPA